MNRKDFFKKLGIGIATVVVAPKVLAEMPTKEKTYPAFNGELIEKRIAEIEQCSTYAPWDYDDTRDLIDSHCGLQVNDVICVEEYRYKVYGFNKEGHALLCKI